MKAILEFDLNDPDDRMEHLRCVKATDMALVLWEITYNQKKGAERMIDAGALKTSDEVIDYIFAQIADDMYNRGIIIDDLIS